EVGWAVFVHHGAHAARLPGIAAAPLETGIRAGEAQQRDQVAPRAVAPRAYAVGVDVVRGGVGAQEAHGAFHVLDLRGPLVLWREPVVDRGEQVTPVAELPAAHANRLLVPARVAPAVHEHRHRPGPVLAGVGAINVHLQSDAARGAIGDVVRDGPRLYLCGGHGQACRSGPGCHA